MLWSRLHSVLALTSLACVFPVASSPNFNSSDDKVRALSYLSTYEANTKELLQQSGNPKCTPDNVAVRRAWDDLNQTERGDYVRAVHCLYNLPSRTDPALAPGARNWVDDYVYQHINVTNFIHISGFLLPWHRQYIWSYERDLRDQCGYRGYLPYWAWERHLNQTRSPVWQSDANSFGGNGEYVPHGVVTVPPIGLPLRANLTPITIVRQPGVGGGCVTDGAFANITLNLGPVSPADPTVNTGDNIYGNHYNPRCLTRDFGSENLTYSVLVDLFEQPDIHAFHPDLELIGHGIPHRYIGGENIDIYSSPNDPSFYLLHSQVDRLWSVWQGLDYEARKNGLDGTLSMNNYPPTPNATLSTIMKMGIPAGGDLPISWAMSTFENDYCYMYM